MKLTPEHQTKLVMEALVKTGGNREEAAKDLGVSLRTLNRYIKDLDLYPMIDKMGWIHHKGPPRGAKGGSVVRMRIIAHIRKNKGEIDYAELAVELYAQDGRVERQRVYSALEDMKKRGQLRIENSRWFVNEDLAKAPVAANG